MLSEALAVHRSVRTEFFRTTSAEPFRVVFVSSVGVLFGMLAIDRFLNAGTLPPIPIWVFVALPAFTAILCGIGVAYINWRFTFTISPDGMVCCDTWGKMLPTAWSKITTARRFSLAGLTYIRIRTSTSRREIWLPLFVDRWGEFRDLEHLQGGAEHIVTKLVEAEHARLDAKV